MNYSKSEIDRYFENIKELYVIPDNYLRDCYLENEILQKEKVSFLLETMDISKLVKFLEGSEVKLKNVIKYHISIDYCKYFEYKKRKFKVTYEALSLQKAPFIEINNEAYIFYELIANAWNIVYSLDDYPRALTLTNNSECCEDFHY